MKINQILSADNLVPHLSEEELAEIRNKVDTTYLNDSLSRSMKNQQLIQIMEMGMLDSQEKSQPWPGCSNVMFPLIATANTNFGNMSYPEIGRDEIVKPKIIGNDEGKPQLNQMGEVIADEQGQPILNNVGAKLKRGERVATFMNWQLCYDMKKWKKDLAKLCYSLSLVGTLFKKTFYDPSNKKICSELIFPNKIIINDGATLIEDTPITHVIELYGHQVVERIRSGYFVDFDFDVEEEKMEAFSQSSGISGPVTTKPEYNNANLHTFLEQHTWYDLDRDGYPEPYVITMYESGSNNDIVRMVRRFTEDSITYVGNTKQIQKIVPENFFTKFEFMPSPDGSFYGIGLGYLLFNINNSINSVINQLIDAGTLGNLGGGFFSRQLRSKMGDMVFRPGEWKAVDNIGGSLRDAIVQLPAPQPSSVLFEMLNFLIGAGKEIGMLKDSISGEMAAGMDAGTMLSLSDQAIRPFKAVYKQIYDSLKEEFGKIFDLNAKYLSDEEYLRVIDEDPSEASVKLDFSKEDYDIVPVADLESITTIQRMAMTNVYNALAGNPYINEQERIRRLLELYEVPDSDKLITTPQPQPDPFVQVEMLKQENKAKEIEIEAIKQSAALEKTRLEVPKLQAEIDALNARALKDIAEAESKEKGRQLNEYIAILDSLHKNAELEMRQKEMEQKAEQDAAQQAQIQEQPQIEPENNV